MSSACLGAALVSAKFGLRSLAARSGAAVSIPTATLLFVIASPLVLDAAGFSLLAALLFALVGLFFPAMVTLLTFESNDRLGPSVTATVSSMTPLFALVAAAVMLGEQIPARALVATCGVVGGVAVLSWKTASPRFARIGWALWLPITGAAVRGVAQVIAKAGLALWPNPFAASLIGYTVSSITVVAADRLPRRKQVSRSRKAVIWFMATGILNGAAVLLMYSALSAAPVSMVAPIVAGYPLVTVLLGAALLHEESLSSRVVSGALLIVAAIAYLVAA